MSSRGEEGPIASLATALDREDAAGFVHVGTRSDPDLRYLSRVDVPDRRLAFVYVAGADTPAGDVTAGSVSDASEDADGDATAGATLVAPAEVATGVDFPGEVVPVEPSTDPAAAAASLLSDRVAGGAAVLAPRQLPHDAALYVEQAGLELASTPAVATARAVKTAWERDRIAAVAAAADAGLARARSVLADAVDDGGTLRRGGEPLTAEGLRRAVNVALAGAGADAAGNTRIEVGDPRSGAPDEGGADGLPAGEPLVVSVTPRGPEGYHAALTRTFVVAGEGGWERRAHVACEAARRVGHGELEAGVPGVGVVEELVAELGSFGFAPAGSNAAGGEGTVASGVGHGVGLAAREAPALCGSDELQPGATLAIGPAVADAADGRVALVDTVVVGEEGVEVLTDAPTSLVPSGE